MALYQGAGATNPKYCRYDEAHGDYLYLQEYVDFIVSELMNAASSQSAIGWSPEQL
jgi:hypothetical protein